MMNPSNPKQEKVVAEATHGARETQADNPESQGADPDNAQAGSRGVAPVFDAAQERARENLQNQHDGGRSMPTEDPKNPASKPQGTTQDQIKNMENEGQAQEPGEPQDSEDKPAAGPKGTTKDAKGGAS